MSYNVVVFFINIKNKGEFYGRKKVFREFKKI